MMKTEQPTIEVIPEDEPEGFAQCDLYEFVDEPDQKLRCFICERIASSEIDGRILVENMDFIFRWIKEGLVPTQPATAKAKRIPLNAS